VVAIMKIRTMSAVLTVGAALLAASAANASADCVNCFRTDRTPAYYATTDYRQVVRHGTTRSHVIPARTVTVRETIGYEPARRVMVRELDSHGRVAWCERWVAGRPITVARRVVRPARVVHRHIPGEVHTLPQRVLVQPAETRLVATAPRWRPAEPQPWW
jgi:hypothetical protein